MLKVYGSGEFANLQQAAAAAPRLRSHLNVHDALDAAVQRLFIATEPDTYMRPHRHPEAHKWEFFTVLQGAIDLLLFDDGGVLQRRIPMAPEGVRAVEVPPGSWHAYLCRAPGSLALEVKQGAYTPTAEADFAPWSPAENSEGAVAFREWMAMAGEGDSFLAAPAGR